MAAMRSPARIASLRRATILAVVVGVLALGCAQGPTQVASIELTVSPFTAQSLICNTSGLRGSLILQARTAVSPLARAGRVMAGTHRRRDRRVNARS
jgi:hypothetical protein